VNYLSILDFLKILQNFCFNKFIHLKRSPKFILSWGSEKYNGLIKKIVETRLFLLPKEKNWQFVASETFSSVIWDILSLFSRYLIVFKALNKIFKYFYILFYLSQFYRNCCFQE